MPSGDDILPGSSSPRWRDEVPQQKGMAREVKILVYSFAVAALLGSIIGLVLWLMPHRDNPRIICLPVNYVKADLAQLQDLPSMHVGLADARALNLLFSQEPENLDIDKYYTKDSIRSSLPKDVKNKASARPLIIYINALGRVDKDKAYLLPGDYRDNEPKTWIDLQELIESIQGQKPSDQNILLLLDLASPTANVYRGTTKNDISTAIDMLLNKMIQARSLHLPVLTSCSNGEISLPLWIERRSLFGYYLEQGLSGEAVGDNRKITVENLHNYMKNRVNHWAETCMGCNQQPKLYKPEAVTDFDLRIYLDKPKKIIPTATAGTSPEEPGKELTEKQRKEEADKKAAAIRAQVEKQFYPSTIQDKWKDRDQLLKSPDWTFLYPELRRWERELLTQERYYQATASPSQTDKLKPPPAFQRPRLKLYYSLHQGVPGSIPSEDAEWKAAKRDIDNYPGNSKSPNPEKPSWITQANDPNKALYMTQKLWEKLMKPANLTAETLKIYTELLAEIEKEPRKSNPVIDRSGPIELVLLKAVGKRTDINSHKDFADHAENYRLILELAGNLEGEIARHEENPVAFAACKQLLQKVDEDLNKAIRAQFSVNGEIWKANAEQNTDLLNKTKMALDDAGNRRVTEQKRDLAYWEAVKTLHATAEWVANSTGGPYDAWLLLADRTKSRTVTPQDINPFKANFSTKESTTKPAMLLNDLQCTLLEAGQRQEALGHLMVKLKEKHDEVRSQDELLLQSKTPYAVNEKTYPESRLSAQRTKIAAELKLLPGASGQNQTSSQHACLNATRELAEWMQDRLTAQLALLNELEAKQIKIDTGYKPLYASASAACKKLADECQNQLKQPR